MRVSQQITFAFATLGLAASTGCPASKPAETPAPAVGKPEAPPSKFESRPECVGRPATTPEETFEVSGRKYVRKGSTVTIEGADADDEFIVGHLTDVKDHTPENVANLKAVTDWMKGEKVDAVVISGDLGESAPSVQGVAEDVAALGVPVLVVIGNRECAKDFNAGIQAAQAKFKNIINMDEVRVFNTDDVSFVSLPGYYNKSYIHCADGCEYSPDDVRALPELAKAATAPSRVLVSHGPPRMSGTTAIDRVHEGANVGDPELAEVLKSGIFPFGLFGNIAEAGGRATNLAGDQIVPAEAWADALYLNPGPADSVRWVMLDGTQSVGMAATVHFKGKQASYKIKRLGAGDAKAGDAKAGDAKAGDAKAGDAKAGDAKAGDAKAGDAKAGDAKAGDAKPAAGK
jgi:Icc-related predicted phosphoesterase